MTIEFRSGGRKVSLDQFFDNIKEQAVELAMTHLEERARQTAGSLVDPATGKHPVVFVRPNGRSQLSMSTRGSPVFARELERRLGVEKGWIRSMNDAVKTQTPVVYLAHGSPDHESLARPFAERLMAEGMDVWLDAWEIGAGDSLRRKMEEGLGNCTHFIVLLTPNSIGRPWVETEIDVGFVRAVEGQSRFIGLRVGVSVGELSPFLQSRRCPTLDLDDDAALKALIADIYGISQKPPRGPSPRYLKSVPDGLQFWTPAAIAVAEFLVRQSKNGVKFDPQVRLGDVAQALGLPDEDVRLAVLDLDEAGLIEKSAELRSGAFWPKPGLFVEFDRHFLDFDNEQDAIAVTNWLVSKGTDQITASDLAQHFSDWTTRRLNSALSYLEEGALIRAQHTIGQGPWAMRSLSVTDRTRRFVRDHG